MGKHRMYIIAGLVTFVGAVVGVGVLYVQSFSSPQLARKTVAVVAGCTQRDQDARLECYRQSVPNLYPEYTIAQIFELLQKGQQIDTLLADCHYIAHRIGEVAIADNPSEWALLIAQEPVPGFCSYGYVHGVTIAAYDSDGLSEKEFDREVSEFQKACLGMSRAREDGCIHALGHMMYYVAGRDTKKALSFCDRATETYSTKDDAPLSAERRCYTGSLMMIFFSILDPDWKEEVPDGLTQESVRAFCEALGNSAYIGACLRASWPLFKDEVQKDGGVDLFCKNQPDAEEARWCYGKVFVALGWLNMNDPDAMLRQCEATSSDWQLSCFQHATKQYLAELSGRRAMPQAVSLCAGATDEDIREGCFLWLTEQSGVYEKRGTTGRVRFCGHLPDRWEKECLQAEDR